MTSHTPGLLAVSYACTLYNKAAAHHYAVPLKLISPWVEAAWDDDEEAAANMRRLAACWNACHGVPIEVLEANAAGGLPEPSNGPIGQASAPELLEVLEGVLKIARDDQGRIVVYGWQEEVIRAAIAKAQKEQP